MLGLQWLTNRVLYHRFWLIRKEVRRSVGYFSKDVRFLDAGCGAGDFLVPAAMKFREGDFTGLDKSEANIDMIRFYGNKRKIRNLRVEAHDLDNQLEAGFFDVVLCASVLQYLKDPGKFIRRMADKLSTGGHLLFYVPLHYRRRLPGYNRIRKQLLKGVDYDHGRLRDKELTAEGLRNDLQNSGFELANEKWLYGPVGQVAYEISSLFILMIKKAPWVISVPATLVYFLIVHPLILVLLGVDYHYPNRVGNGLFIRAIKK
jgi:SAM-dependent methyltransferase